MKVLTLLVARLLAITLPAYLVSCAMRGSEPIEVLMTYSATEVRLSEKVTLKHSAGEPSDDESDPWVGYMDSERTKSRWQLLQDGVVMSEFGSFLSDPKFCLEMESYYSGNDRVYIYASKSLNTMVVNEERAPTFPRMSFIVFHRTEDGVWQSSQVVGALQGILGVPSVVSVTDEFIVFTEGENRVRYPLR